MLTVEPVIVAVPVARLPPPDVRSTSTWVPLHSGATPLSVTLVMRWVSGVPENDITYDACTPSGSQPSSSVVWAEAPRDDNARLTSTASTPRSSSGRDLRPDNDDYLAVDIGQAGKAAGVGTPSIGWTVSADRHGAAHTDTRPVILREVDGELPVDAARGGGRRRSPVSPRQPR